MPNKLSVDRLKELLAYDPETGLFVRRGCVGSKLAGSVAGTVHPKGYRIISVDNRLYRSTRLAWFYMTGEWPEHEIDHRNRNRGDDRWENLRECTHAQNMQNRGRSHHNTSGVTGVHWDGHSKWRAMIMKDKKQHRLGRFDTIEEAADAYAKAKAVLHTFQPTVA